ncbi:unnamed protein product [Caenorhabditis auriculariae]|uniref:Uncharacterized protein n=1 Tax=Caenorhabditis auriculariae TaxID=2777116 RepID=A0A8S1HFN3_9PELO|nr:unnamed protein product [Caenorhabditis auriculariae]
MKLLAILLVVILGFAALAEAETKEAHHKIERKIGGKLSDKLFSIKHNPKLSQKQKKGALKKFLSKNLKPEEIRSVGKILAEDKHKHPKKH